MMVIGRVSFERTQFCGHREARLPRADDYQSVRHGLTPAYLLFTGERSSPRPQRRQPEAIYSQPISIQRRSWKDCAMA